MQKKVAFQNEIQIDSVSINPFQFQISDKNFKTIDTTQYTVDFGKSILKFKANTTVKTDSIIINYKNILIF